MARSACRARGFVVATTFTARPAISGMPQVGQTLTATNGTIAGGTFASRQWFRDGVPIAGAAGVTYVVQAADIGRVISVVSTANLTSGGTVTASSTPTGAVLA